MLPVGLSLQGGIEAPKIGWCFKQKHFVELKN
jgi:hypothetical protein